MNQGRVGKIAAKNIYYINPLIDHEFGKLL